MEEVCSGCRRKISEDERRDILAEDPSIRFYDETDTRRAFSSLKCIKLSDAIELITGGKIDRRKERFVNLCDQCFEKVESYISFRARLLASFSKPVKSDPPSSNQNPVRYESVVLPADESPALDSDLVIHVDEENQPTELISSSTDDVDGNDSGREAKLRNDHENNNLNDSESSSDNADVAVSSVLSKVQENDLESEIDVCSGEDDEVLELDAQHCRAVQSVDLDSSESDLEVCDYEPTGKRIKNYHTLSSSVLFSTDRFC